MIKKVLFKTYLFYNKTQILIKNSKHPKLYPTIIPA